MAPKLSKSITAAALQHHIQKSLIPSSTKLKVSPAITNSLSSDEKYRRYRNSLSLAERLDLVKRPTAPLLDGEWEGVRARAEQREVESALKQVDQDDHLCPICLQGFRAGMLFAVLPCTHMFHDSCFRSYLKMIVNEHQRQHMTVGQGRCPVCRGRGDDWTTFKDNGLPWKIR